MNNVREICELTLDVPAPPLPPAADALAVARRASRRRQAGTTLFAAAAVVTVVAGIGLVAASVTSHSGGTGDISAPTNLAQPAASAPIATMPPPAVPSWQQAQAHGQQVADLLIAAVPAGYSGAPQYPSATGPASTWLREPPSNWYGSTTSIVVSAAGRQGLLEEYTVRDEVTAVDGDLCSAAMATRIDAVFGTGTHCHTVISAGVPVRVTQWTDPELGDVTLALRLLDRGFLAVMASEGRWNYQGDTDLPPDAVSSPGPTQPGVPPLLTSVFTSAQLVALAADPAMLP